MYHAGANHPTQPPTIGNLTKTERGLDTNNSDLATGWEYDQWGNMTAEIDAVGATTDYTYDDVSHIYLVEKKRRIRQSGVVHAMSFNWDPVCGAIVRQLDVNSQPTDQAYDPL